MKIAEVASKFAFVGMKHEPEDIIDYVAVCFSLVTSILVGIVGAIWIGRSFDTLAGLLAGIGFYALSMTLCSFVLRHERRG